MKFIFQESKVWEAGNPPAEDRPKRSIKAKNEARAKKKLPQAEMGRVWVLIDTIPDCNCGSTLQDENGRIHFEQCAVIQHELGYI